MSPRSVVLYTMGLLGFASVYAHVIMAPVLSQIAREFGTTPGAAALVVAAYGVPGIAVAVLAGPYSDQYGRKPFLVGGSVIMGIFTLVGALAPTFETLVISRALAGLGAAVVFPNIQASIADAFPYGERGKALSTVVAFNTVASIAGIPIAGILAEATSWRFSLALVGVIVLIATALVWRAVPARPPGGDFERARELYLRIVKNVSAMAAIASSFGGAVFWFTWITFIVVYFELTYGLSQGQASLAALTTGVGVLIGSQIGGRLGDRIGHRRIVAGAIFIAAILLLGLTLSTLPLPVAIGLNLVLSAVTGARFTTNQVLLTEQVPEARGTMLAMSASVVSAGIVAGVAIGGPVVDVFGFAGLGIVCAVAALASTIVVVLWVNEESASLAQSG